MSLSKISKSFALCACILMSAYIIMLPKEAISACTKSIEICLSSIIPSLFAFMVVTTFLLKSGLYYYLFLPIKPIGKYIFRMQHNVFSIFLLSQIGGFPIGAKLLYEMKASKEISEEYANKLIYCCFCSGPSFVIGVVAVKLYNNMLTGLFIYLSLLISNCIIAIIIGRKSNSFSENAKPKITVNENVFIDSVNSSSIALFKVCSMIIFFSVIISAVNLFFENDFFNGILEISSISESRLSLPYVSALLSFGGICVIFQIVSIFGNTDSVVKFIIIRIMSAFLSGVIMKIILAFNQSISICTLINVSNSPVASKYNLIPSFLLIIMTLLLLKATYSNNAQ